MFGNVLDRDQTFEFKGFIDNQQALEFVFVEQGFGLFGCGAFRHGDQSLTRRHDLFDLHVVTGFKAQIAAADNAHHFAAFANWKSRDAHLIRHGHNLAHGVLGRDDDRVEQDATFVALDLGDFSSLFLCAQVFMNNPHAALLGNRNGQASFCDRIHGGRHQGQIQSDAARELG